MSRRARPPRTDPGPPAPAVAPPKADPPPNEYVTTAELCRRLSISRKTVSNHRLHRYAIRLGSSQWRFRWSDILRHYGAPVHTDAQR